MIVYPKFVEVTEPDGGVITTVYVQNGDEHGMLINAAHNIGAGTSVAGGVDTLAGARDRLFAIRQYQIAAQVAA